MELSHEPFNLIFGRVWLTESQGITVFSKAQTLSAQGTGADQRNRHGLASLRSAARTRCGRTRRGGARRRPPVVGHAWTRRCVPNPGTRKSFNAFIPREATFLEFYSFWVNPLPMRIEGVGGDFDL